MEVQMTGIERLRKMAGLFTSPEMPNMLANDLNDIADQIEREQGEAETWVREHGGLDAVKRRWECLSYYADPVPRSCMEKRLARLQRQIDESHAALRRRNARVSELNNRACDLTRENAELRKRAMPEGYEWPCFESGEPVKFGDVVSDGDETGRVYYVTFDTVNPVIIGFTDETPDQDPGTWLEVSVNDGERVKRPTPKVLDADGVEIRVGDTVYYVDGREQKVNTVAHLTDGLVQFGRINEAGYVTYCEGACISPDQLTHRTPVIAADGRPLREGETVWDENGDELVIGALEDGGHTVTCRYADVGDAIPVHGMWSPSQLTHERPVIAADGKPLEVGQTVWLVDTGVEYWVKSGQTITADAVVIIRKTDCDCESEIVKASQLTHERPESWGSLEDDATLPAATYCERMGIEVEEGCSFVEPMARDLVRRARALAGVSE